MTHTSPPPALRLGLVLMLLIGLAGCSAIFDGHEYLSADASARDSATDASDSAVDSALPDPCAGACSGVTSICEPTGATCVACLSDHDCSGTNLACETATHTCVECTADNTTACTGEAPLCVLAAGDARVNSCAVCNSNDDCPDATPVCTDHVCGGCAAPTDCAGRPGKLACDTTSGACVACNDATADVNCPATGVCTQAHECSAFTRGTQGQCDPCDAEGNCVANHDCVPMTFGDPMTPHGSYCLKLASAGCTQPYSVGIDTSSLGGTIDTFCAIDQTLTTCEAVRALVENITCSAGLDSDCPEGGLCRTVGVLSGRCTYECVGPAQCLAVGTGADSCGTGAVGVSYCGG